MIILFTYNLGGGKGGSKEFPFYIHKLKTVQVLLYALIYERSTHENDHGTFRPGLLSFDVWHEWNPWISKMMNPECGQQLDSLLAKLRKAYDSTHLNLPNLMV